ncbi:DUF2218 domain-containing protein [Streptomyces venetus]|uniref:DUF2218 domain-containing protein n=1 Tax=Streptomyces venetus TaxID=1701086 RepID=UPI003C30AC9F
MSDERSSTASVSTTSPERYAKQLAAHLGRRAQVRQIDGDTEITFDEGACLLQPGDNVLHLRASSRDEDGLAIVKDVVGRHLERFGQRHELRVDWHDE